MVIMALKDGDGIILFGKDNPFYGRRYTPVEKEKISFKTKEAMKNPLIRKKISDGLKGAKNPNYGKKRSKELQKKMSENSHLSRMLKSRLERKLNIEQFLDQDYSNKKILMLDENQNIIVGFNSIREAGITVIKNGENLQTIMKHINSCCSRFEIVSIWI